jgi:hypothetical protein
MPIPKEQQDQMEGVARVSELAATLLRDPQFLKALNDLHDNPDEAKKASRDPAGYLRSKRVRIPAGADASVPTVGASITVCIEYPEATPGHPGTKYCVGWDNERGWFFEIVGTHVGP